MGLDVGTGLINLPEVKELVRRFELTETGAALGIAVEGSAIPVTLQPGFVGARCGNRT